MRIIFLFCVLCLPALTSANSLEIKTTELQCLFGNGRPKSKPIVANSLSSFEDIVRKGFHDALQEFLVSQQQNIYFATPDYRERVKNLKLTDPGKYEYEYMLKVRPDLKKFFESEEPPMLMMESCRFPEVDFSRQTLIFAYLEGCLSSYEIKSDEDKEKQIYKIDIVGIKKSGKCATPVTKDLVIIVDTPKATFDVQTQVTYETRK